MLWEQERKALLLEALKYEFINISQEIGLQKTLFKIKCVHYLLDAMGYMILKEKDSLRPAAISMEMMDFKDDPM